MNRYTEMNKRHRDELRGLWKMAFSEKAFQKMMNEWGYDANDTDKICVTPGGMFIRKCDFSQFSEIAMRHYEEMQYAINSDATGEGFIYEMFLHALSEHTYGNLVYAKGALSSLNFTFDDLLMNKRFTAGFCKALTQKTSEIKEPCGLEARKVPMVGASGKLGYQLWETMTDDSSALSSVFETLDDLCIWCESNEKIFLTYEISREQWKEFLTGESKCLIVFKD